MFSLSIFAQAQFSEQVSHTSYILGAGLSNHDSKKINLYLSYEANHFYNEVQSSNFIENSQYQFTNSNAKIIKKDFKNLDNWNLGFKWNSNSFIFDSSAKVYNRQFQNLSYLSISEAYWITKTSNYDSNLSIKFILGRKLSLWSELDSTWHLGLWNPILKYEPFNTMEQGLMGIGLETKSQASFLVTGDFVESSFFYNSIFIPHQEPLSTIHPWSKLNPPSQISIYEVPTAIEYHIQRPNISEVIDQQGYSASLMYSIPKIFSTRISMGQLPMNEFLFAIQNKLNSSEKTPYLSTTILPVNLYHQLSSFDAMIDFQIVKINFHSLNEMPMPYEVKGRNKAWILPVPSNTHFQGVDLIIPVLQKFEFELSYIEKSGGKLSWLGKFSDFINDNYNSRFGFEKKNKLVLNWKQGTKLNIHHKFQMEKELIDKSEWVSYNFQLQLPNQFKNWSIYGGTELFFAPMLTTVSTKSDFVVYQNHDYFYGGMRYVY